MQNFSIELNATMFEMLSSKVYTDTIMAPIREWSTNAVDACVAGGLPVKFEVHVPTILEPYFSVRDYGIGLSDEDVLGLYSTLGASTKRGSNEFNGVFGVGRNSGLAYTDSFQVESYFNGTKISYLVSTDAGIPAMISLGSEPTDEPNGLNLQLSVLNKDIDKFKTRCLEVFQYFDHRPKTNVTLDYHEPVKVIAGKDWYLEESHHSLRNSGKPLAIMGNVAYTIPPSSFEDRALYNILHSSIRFNVPLGEVSITPGRESLSMDDMSIKYLTKRLARVKEEAKASLIRTVEALPTIWEQSVAFNEALSNSPGGLATDVEWNPKSGYITADTSYRGSSKLKLTGFINNDDLAFQVFESWRVTGKNLKTTDDRHYIDKHIHFMLADQRFKVSDAAVAYKNTIPGAKVIVIKPDKWCKDKLTEQMTLMKDFIKNIGSPKFVLASDWAPVQSVTISTAGSQIITAKDFTPLQFSVNKGHLVVNVTRRNTLSYYKNIKKFYYVEMSSYIVDNMDMETLSTYVRFAEIYRDQNKDKKDDFIICGVPKGGMKNIEKDPRFVPLKDALGEYAKDVNFTDKSETEKWAKFFYYFNSSEVTKFTDTVKNKEVKQTLSELQKFDKKYPRSHYVTKTDGIAKLFACKTIAPKCDLTMSQIEERYPLAQYLMSGGYGCRATAPDLVRYVELEDIYRERKKGKV